MFLSESEFSVGDFLEVNFGVLSIDSASNRLASSQN